jgi:hypothetical protein
VCPIPRETERKIARDERAGTSEEPELGVVPDAESTLNRTEVRLRGDMAATLDTPEGADPDRTSFLFTEELSARISSKHVSVFAAKGRAQQFLHADDGKSSWWTATRAGIGVRHVRGIDANHIRGMGARLELSHGSGAEHLRAQRPFESMRFNNSQAGQLTLEVRYELMGCFAPFAHLQAGARIETEDEDEDYVFAAPVGLTVGAHREVGEEPIMIWGGYEVTARRADVLGRVFDQRLRVGAEWLHLGELGLRLGGAFEIMVGPVDGTFASLTLTAPLDLRSPVKR